MSEIDDNPYRSPNAPGRISKSKRRPVYRWYSLVSIIFSMGSVVAKCIALSYASKAMMDAAGGNTTRQYLANAADRVELLVMAMLLVSLITGIPAVLKDASLRFLVLIAFFIGFIFSLLIV